MKILLAQFNPLIGDLSGNTKILCQACVKANKANANLILTPELSLWGYPPKDLLLDKSLIKLQEKSLQGIQETLINKTNNVSILVGIAERTEDNFSPNLYNSIVHINQNGWKVVARKQLLPTYDVFDEKRYFRTGNSSNILLFKETGKIIKIGLTICEDIWVDELIQGEKLSGPDPIKKLIPEKLDILINLSASPFSKTKKKYRELLAKQAVRRLGCPVLYLNQVGANDELIFDGSSFILNEKAETICKLKSYQEEFEIWNIANNKKIPTQKKTSPQEEIFRALVFGLKDYAKKCGFSSTIIGLSGGIDSALVAIIAAAALGKERITSVLMPSPWSSSGSLIDAIALTQRINSRGIQLPIGNLMNEFGNTLSSYLGNEPKGITAENLQSRIRGTLLMAVANHEGHLLLCTGNKSELAVGYCTLYGDMNGGLAVIGDLYKTEVFSLCEWIDSDDSQACRKALGLPEQGELIGREIRNKPPSAELKPGQLDSDSLPNYPLLDSILKGLIEEKKQPNELINEGIDKEIVMKVVKLLRKGEFKRHQAPPLLKVSDQAFGSGRRLPIAAK